MAQFRFSVCMLYVRIWPAEKLNPLEIIPWPWTYLQETFTVCKVQKWPKLLSFPDSLQHKVRESTPWLWTFTLKNGRSKVTKKRVMFVSLNVSEINKIRAVTRHLPGSTFHINNTFKSYIFKNIFVGLYPLNICWKVPKWSFIFLKNPWKLLHFFKQIF